MDMMTKTRLALEQDYMAKWQEGRRIRKNSGQMEVLMQYFERDPNWPYQLKLQIASQIDMTPSQVSKWNWD